MYLLAYRVNLQHNSISEKYYLPNYLHMSFLQVLGIIVGKKQTKAVKVDAWCILVIMNVSFHFTL